MKQVRACCQALERFERSYPPSSNSKLLVSVFVVQMVQFYERQTGKPAPRSRRGLFVKFLEDAWAGVRFSATDR